MSCMHFIINIVLSPDPTSRREEGLVNIGRILGSLCKVHADKAMQSLDLIGLHLHAITTGGWAKLVV